MLPARRASFAIRASLSVQELSRSACSVPTGAAKTTLVRVLSTLIQPDAGEVTVAGHDLFIDPLAVKRAISLTGQFAAVDDVLTGRENLEMMAALLRVPRRRLSFTVNELLVSFGERRCRPARRHLLRRGEAAARPSRRTAV